MKLYIRNKIFFNFIKKKMDETGIQNPIFKICADIKDNKMNPMNSMIGIQGMMETNQIGMMEMNQMDFLNQSQMMNQTKNNELQRYQMNDEIQNMNPMMMNQMNQMNNNNNQINQENQLAKMFLNNLGNQMTNMANQMKNDELPEQQSGGISLIFRKGGADADDTNPPPSIQCLPDEKVSDVIQRYRSKSGDNDPTKKFIFNIKALNCDLTVAEAGLTNNCNIFVVSTKGIKGAGCAMLFTDLSKNKTKEIGFSKNAPSYRRATKGINIFGICNCKKCKAYKKEVVVPIKKKKLDLIKERDELFCPECEATIIPKTVGFYLCKFIIYGKKLVDDQVERFENEEDEANKKDKLKYFDPELNGEIMVTELIFEVLEYL